MKPLSDAIAATYNNSTPLKTALPGGLFFGKKPEIQGAATPVLYPYCTCLFESSPATTYFGGPSPRYSEIATRFQVYGEGAPDGSTSGYSQASGGMDAIETAFRDTILTLTGAQNTNSYAMHEPRPMPGPEPEVNENGNEVWMWFVTYVYTVRK